MLNHHISCSVAGVQLSLKCSCSVDTWKLTAYFIGPKSRKHFIMAWPRNIRKDIRAMMHVTTVTLLLPANRSNALALTSWPLTRTRNVVASAIFRNLVL